MITRSQIRRQLRSQGGIMNVVGRQKYGLGSFVRKAFGKAKDVVSNVVKSPIGKAAIIGLGGAGLMGMGPLAGLSGIGAKIGGLGKAGGLSSFFGKGSFNPLKMAMNPGGGGGLGLSSFGSLLGKVGLATDAGGLSTIGKVIGAGGLLGYFTSKGIAPEEAEQLSQDVYRGKGAGLDMIKADIQKYKSGESSESEMFAKGYNFLPQKKFIRQGSADGGRIGYDMGGLSTIERAKALFEERDEAAPTPSPGIGSIKQMSNEDKAMIQQFIEATSQDKGVRYTDPDGNEMTSKQFQDEMSRITELENMTMPKKKPKKAKGGMMNIPMGKPRKNAGGITELDYRASGGFVPVGIKEKADDVPAMLSKNEFVMTADAVRGAGNGSIKKGAQRMYDLMKQNESKVV